MTNRTWLLLLFLLFLISPVLLQCAPVQRVNCSPAGIAAVGEICATLLEESTSRCEGDEGCAEYQAVSEVCLGIFEAQDKTCQ